MKYAIKTGQDGRQAVLEGINLAADIVKSTLGVSGRNVGLDLNDNYLPDNTNDGVTILRELKFDDPFKRYGLKLVREIAAKTNDEAGDATSTASTLYQAIVNEGNKAIIVGADPVSVRRGIEKATKTLVDYIEKNVTKATDLRSLTNAATISCGDPVLGKLIAEVVFKSGLEGVVTFEDNNEPETVSEQVSGLKLRGSFTLPNFINVPERQQAALSNVPIFVTNQSISSAQDIKKIMDTALALKQKQVVILANSIEGDALITSATNWVNNKFHVLPIRVITYGEMGEGVLRDAAAITGAKYFDGAAGDSINNLLPEHFGNADKIVADKHETTLVAGTEKVRADRIKQLHAQIKATDREFERESMRERIAKLNNALFTIKVGGQTDSERQDRKRRVEDAINTTRKAMIFGIVSGGGSTLYRASKRVKNSLKGDEAIGFNTVLKACTAPLKQMAFNGSVELDGGDLFALLDGNLAIDFRTGDVVDAFKVGIVDSIKANTASLKNAASGAALFLVTDTFAVKYDERDEEL